MLQKIYLSLKSILSSQKLQIMIKQVLLFSVSLLILLSCSQNKRTEEDTRMSGNPVFEGWYADPDGIIFDDTYWIYPTFSARYGQQLHLDAFSSPDLIHWTKHERIIDNVEVDWIWQAMWAPSIIKHNNKYYLFFAGNDIQNNDELGGIGVAVANRPEGPFKDLLGKPLIDQIIHGAQPIDQYVFRDVDGTHYIYYGGWRHCNVAKLNDDFTGFIPFENGEIFKSITPENYVEGPFMFMRNGKYYFMWSEGGWGLPNYSVAYAIADNPLGPFERIGTVLEQNPEIATSAGHHSVIYEPKSGKYYIVYHRRPLEETDRDHRVVCIDEMFFDEEGFIKPVVITHEGVRANPLK
jgi:beta-xylosidase